MLQVNEECIAISEMKIVRLKRGEKLPSASTRRVAVSAATSNVTPSSKKSTSIRQLNLDSPTFGAELVAAFRENVAKARRENKRLLGIADIDIDKT